MMYTLIYRDTVKKVFDKLAKRNPKQLEIIAKKLDEVMEDPDHYKNLLAPMNHCRRVHIDKSFVLTFSVDEQTKIIVIEDYDHHDKIYR